MKLSKDELLTELKAYTGERTDDETLKLIEDVSDSIDVNGNGEADSEDAKDWQAAYEDLAKKYKARFTEKVEDKTGEKEEAEEGGDEEEKAAEIKTEDLFEEEK